MRRYEGSGYNKNLKPARKLAAKVRWEIICWDTEEDRNMGENYAYDVFHYYSVAVKNAENLFYRQAKACVEVVNIQTGLTYFICADGKCEEIKSAGYKKNPALLLISNPSRRRRMSHNPPLLLIHNPKAAKIILLKALESAQSKKYERAENYMKHFMNRIAMCLPRGRFNARELRMNYPELFSLYESTLKLMPI